MPMLIEKTLHYVLKDNLGHEWQCKYKKIEDQSGTNSSYKSAFKTNNFICWYYEEYEDKDDGKRSQNGHYYYLSPSSRIKGIYRNCPEGLTFIHTPIKDYEAYDQDDGGYLHFNPSIESEHSINNHLRRLRKNKGIYFEQKFFIEYTEEELSKLTSITIENKTD